MRSIVYTGPRSFSLTEVDEPELGPGEVRLAITGTGVCGTDLHLHEGHFGAQFPLTPGHEIVGKVIEVGQASSLSVDDQVVVENGVFCGHCQACRDGQFLYCTKIRALGISLPGGAAQRLVVSEAKCYPVGGLSLDRAVLAEPLACVIHAVDRLAIHPGSKILVLGTGTAGQLLALMTRRNGAGQVTVTGSSRHKLAIAKELGADRVLAVNRAPGAIGSALDALEPDGFDVVVDATGAVSMLRAGIGAAAVGGTVMVYGVARAEDTLEIEPYEIFKRELTIMGSYAQVLNLGRAVEYLSHIREPIERLITHRFRLAQYGKALEALGSSECIKAVLTQ